MDKERMHLSEGEHQRILFKRSYVSPNDILVAKAKDRITKFYSKIKLSPYEIEKLESFGERANIFKEEFQRNIEASMNNTIKGVVSEIDIGISQRNNAGQMILRVEKAIAGRAKALQRLMDLSYRQLKKYMVLWEYQDKGFLEYMLVNEGENCDVCSSLAGKVFLIEEARTGENLAPLHPNCDCKANILDEEGNVVLTVDDDLDYENLVEMTKVMPPRYTKNGILINQNNKANEDTWNYYINHVHNKSDTYTDRYGTPPFTSYVAWLREI